jgi:hypothetical protein
MRKKTPQKINKIKGILFEHRKGNVALSYIINKKPKQDPFLISNDGDTVLSTYMERCKRYGLRGDPKIYGVIEEAKNFYKH